MNAIGKSSGLNIEPEHIDIYKTGSWKKPAKDSEKDHLE